MLQKPVKWNVEPPYDFKTEKRELQKESWTNVRDSGDWRLAAITATHYFA